MEFSRQEYWNGLPFPTPGDLPHPGIEPLSLASHALTVGFFTTSATEKPHCDLQVLFYFVLMRTCTHPPTPNHTVSPEWGEKRQAFLEDQLGNSRWFQYVTPSPCICNSSLFKTGYIWNSTFQRSERETVYPAGLSRLNIAAESLLNRTFHLG